MRPVRYAELPAAAPFHHCAMSLIGLSDDQIELIGQGLAALDDYVCASVGDILHVTFDCGEF
jgi:hypothetical protein